MPSKIAMELAWKMTSACIDDAAVIDTYLQAQREAAWAEAVEAFKYKLRLEWPKSSGPYLHEVISWLDALRPPMETKES